MLAAASTKRTDGNPYRRTGGGSSKATEAGARSRERPPPPAAAQPGSRSRTARPRGRVAGPGSHQAAAAARRQQQQPGRGARAAARAAGRRGAAGEEHARRAARSAKKKKPWGVVGHNMDAASQPGTHAARPAGRRRRMRAAAAREAAPGAKADDAANPRQQQPARQAAGGAPQQQEPRHTQAQSEARSTTNAGWRRCRAATLTTRTQLLPLRLSTTSDTTSLPSFRFDCSAAIVWPNALSVQSFGSGSRKITCVCDRTNLGVRERRAPHGPWRALRCNKKRARLSRHWPPDASEEDVPRWVAHLLHGCGARLPRRAGGWERAERGIKQGGRRDGRGRAAQQAGTCSVCFACREVKMNVSLSFPAP